MNCKRCGHGLNMHYGFGLKSRCHSKTKDGVECKCRDFVSNLFLIVAMLLSSLTSVYASSNTIIIKATGEGLDRKSAIREAQRNAMEEAVGVYVKANTVVEKSMLKSDTINARTQGRIVSSTILNEKVDGDKFIVEIRAVIDPTGKDFGTTSAMDMYAALSIVNGQAPTNDQLETAVADPSKVVKSYVTKLSAELPNVPKPVLQEEVAKQLDMSVDDVKEYTKGE